MISDATKGTSLHFDPYNQLDSVAVPGYGPSCLRFAYNSSGERVSKTHVYWRREVCGGGIYKVLESTGTSGVSGPEPPPDTLASMCWKQKTASTYYVYGNGQVLAEYANPAVAGSPQAKYIYAGDRRIAMIDQSGNLFFYLNDHLGSARVVMNAQTGRAADYHWYSAYGEVWGEHTSTNQAYKYTGKPFDDEGGFDLYYYGARYYDPILKIFTQVDPLDSKYPGWGPYVYTLDNPLKYVDPDGEKVEYAAGNATQANINFGSYDPRTTTAKLDPSFKTRMDKSVTDIVSTKVGNQLLYGLENMKDAAGNDVMVYIVENNAGELFHLQMDANTHIVSIDPNANPSVQVKDLSTGQTNSEPASTTRILSHELGHATGTKDDGAKKMNNVKKYENPIMIPLENKERVEY